MKKEEEKALVAMANKFTTCTLNPEMAARLIDESNSVSEGENIVDQAKETQSNNYQSIKPLAYK